MKEITITNTIILPTEKELEEVAKLAEITEPKQAIIVNLCLSNYDFDSEESKAVYKCMKEAEKFLRSDIASDIVVAYCNEKNIKWGFIRILNITEYEKHFTIEALIENRVVE